jgi:hypothetical protein
MECNAYKISRSETSSETEKCIKGNQICLTAVGSEHMNCVLLVHVISVAELCEDGNYFYV